jgi:FkbM family methyltransferase
MIKPGLFIASLLNNSFRLLKILRGVEFYSPLQYSCQKKTFGNKDASFTINPDSVSSQSIVYSAGIGTDISFDLELIKKFGVTIFAFDPTPKSIQWLKQHELPTNFKSFPIGLANYSGVADFFLPENKEHVSASMVSRQSESMVRVNVKTISDIMKDLGHTSIDLLKMDIEGAEYDVIENIIEQNINVKQLLVEFHHRQKSIGKQKTIAILKKLNKAGYKVFHISLSGEEYSLIKM